MRATRLLPQLTLYYPGVTAAVALALYLYPGLRELLPIGGVQTLLTDPKLGPLESTAVRAAEVGNFGESVVWLGTAIIGSLLTVVPVSWTYMEVRDRDEYDQSMVETIVILPIAVTSIIVVVYNSLALAFSLAGIVGLVRFRNTLKSSGDALFVLIVVGIGISAGIGAIELGVVMSIAFNYCFVLLWFLDYGARKGTHRFLRKNHAPHRAPGEAPPEAPVADVSPAGTSSTASSLPTP